MRRSAVREASARRHRSRPHRAKLASPTGTAAGERLLPRLERALNRLPARIAGSGAIPRGRGQGVKTHLRPNPYQPLGLGGRSRHGPDRSCATSHRGAGPQDVVAALDEQEIRRASLEARSAHRTPVSFARSGTVVSRSAIHRLARSGDVLGLGLGTWRDPDRPSTCQRTTQDAISPSGGFGAPM